MPAGSSRPRPFRVLILSATFGGGHGASATALRDYFRSRYRREVDVEVVDFFEEFAQSLNVLAKFAYQQPAPFFPAAYGTFSELVERLPANPVVHELKIMGFDRVEGFITDREPDAIISTFAVAGGVVAEIKSGRSPIAATVITGFGAHGEWLHPATDLFFVACDEARDDLVVRGIPYERVVVSGIPVSDGLLPAVGSAGEARRSLGLANRFTVLFAPGRGSVNDAAALAERIAGTGVQVAAIAGRDERLRGRLTSAARRNGLVKVFGCPDGMHSMMLSADVLVAKAGELTVFEALAMRLPLLMLGPVPGQEVMNVDFLVNSGAGLCCRDEGDVVEKIRFLANHPHRLTQMSGNAGGLGRSAAAQSVCERVLAAARSGRG